MSNTIFEYISEQEEAFRKPIPVEDGWYWGFMEHVRRSFLYKNSQFEENNDDRGERPFKNIVRPIINVQYRTEGFDVKDIDIYVDSPTEYYKSFLIKKYYQKWALENEMDTFIDELVESFVDYGGALVKKTKNVRPEVIDLRTIAFCDQTDILAGPFAIKHFFSPRQLEDMKKNGWGVIGADIDIDSLILKAEAAKRVRKDRGEIKTPGKYVEIYEIHNVCSMDFDPLSKDTEQMMYIVAFYEDETGQKQGRILFSSPEPILPFKFIKRDPIKGRALGWGGIEELFEPQTWTNFAEIHMVGMLRQASKILYVSTDPRFKNQNVGAMDNGQILDLQPNSDVRQLDTVPRNISIFENYVITQHEHAMEMGSASDISLGNQPNSGTPFKSVETQLVENKSLHLWRQGRIATFMEELHREWIIPRLGKDVVKGDKFLVELSSNEMMQIGEQIVTNEANKKIIEMVLDGRIPTDEEVEQFKQITRETFSKQGNKKFIEILDGEMAKAHLSVYMNIAGKQRNLALLTDKLVNYVRQLLATPQITQDPAMMNHVNEILEYSGLSPITGIRPMLMNQEGSTEPLKALAEVS